MNIKYIDTICTNTKHIIFNASLLGMLLKIQKNISFYGEKNNVEDVLNVLQQNTIDIQGVKKKYLLLPIASSGIRTFFVFILSFFYNLYFIIFSSRQDLLVFNYNNLFVVRMINAINKICNRNILIFCHGEMEFLISDPKKYGPLNSLLLFFAKNFFLNQNINIHHKINFVVMGESILYHIKKVVPANISKSFVSVNHSYFFNNKKTQKINIQEHNKINIGTVGLFSKIKGGDDFCKLCQLIDRNRFSFSITGRVFYDLKILESLQINLPTNKGCNAISREELEKRVEELDIIVYFYPTTSYKLIASGAILDAISMRKPILALRNDYFSYIFEQFGHFGYLVDSVEEMADILQHIKKKDLTFDFDLIQQKLNIDTISEELMLVLNKYTLTEI